MTQYQKIGILLIALFSLNFVHAQWGDAKQYEDSPKKKNNPSAKLDEVFGLINQYYTDTVNNEKLVEDAIGKVLEDLDPHSSYVPAKDVERSQESLVGNFEGIGVSFQLLKDTITVVEVIPGGPSEKVGLLAGDKIITVNDTTVAGIKIDNNGVIKRLRGNKGTKVQVGILRGSESGLIPFTIVRDKIPIYSITAHYMAAPSIGYIRLERFSATTMTEFTKAVQDLRLKGMKDLVIDLQGNVGGYLYTAVDMCNQFLGDNQLIVYTQGLHSNYQPYFSNGRGMFQSGKVVVMVDEGSASAAEILSGCLQDNDRGLLVGRRTFGKGLVQKPFYLSDGSQLKLTTAHYYTPSGRNIQKPYNHGVKEYREDYKERYDSGELFGTDTFKFPDSLLYHTKNGRKVYGGGGIMPDFFVPVDTSNISPLFNALVRRGVENKFCLEYVDNHRKALNAKYPNDDSFFNHFTVDTAVLKAYFNAALADSVIRLRDGIVPQGFWQYFGSVENDSAIHFEKDFNRSADLIKARLKAGIGRNLFDTGMWYRVINSSVNNIYEKAMEVISKASNFDELKPTVAATPDNGKAKSKKNGKAKIKIKTK